MSQGELPIIRPVMPELDSIRGIAILMVLFYHGFFWQVDMNGFQRWERLALMTTWCGRLGVNLFFVLSGFLITGLLLDSRTRSDFYFRFYKRRARRILPAYLLVLSVLLIARAIPASFAFLSFAYLSNLTPLFGVSIAYPVLWSLAVEEHFYLGWPAVVRRLPLPALLGLSLAVALCSPVLRFLSYPYAHGFEFNDYTWNSLDGLALGAAVAIALRMTKNQRTAAKKIAAWATGVAILLSPYAIASRTADRLGSALQVVPWHAAFVAVLCICLLIGSSEDRRSVQSRVLGFFGYISYGLYLVHVAVFNFLDHHWKMRLPARFIVAAAVSILLAYLSRTYFENRFLSRKPFPRECQENTAPESRSPEARSRPPH